MEERGVVKTSAIFIASGGKTVLYHALKDVPPRLRRKLLKLNGNAATVLIADRRGMEELLRARQEQVSEPVPPSTPTAGRLAGLPLIATLRRYWLEILLVGGLPLLLWLVFQIRL
jgi:hypothetical protein